ncbi:unnamed protein product, partial [Iphiclides podalirius]
MSHQSEKDEEMAGCSGPSRWCHCACDSVESARRPRLKPSPKSPPSERIAHAADCTLQAASGDARVLHAPMREEPYRIVGDISVFPCVALRPLQALRRTQAPLGLCELAAIAGQRPRGALGPLCSLCPLCPLCPLGPLAGLVAPARPRRSCSAPYLNSSKESSLNKKIRSRESLLFDAVQACAGAEAGRSSVGTYFAAMLFSIACYIFKEAHTTNSDMASLNMHAYCPGALWERLQDAIVVEELTIAERALSPRVALFLVCGGAVRGASPLARPD